MASVFGAHRQPAPGPPRLESAPVPRPCGSEQPGTAPDHRPLARAWCTSTSRRSGASPTVVAGGLTVGAANRRRRQLAPRPPVLVPAMCICIRRSTGSPASLYTEALYDEKAMTAIGFTHRARVFFAAHGIGHIHRVVTDRGRATGRRTSRRCCTVAGISGSPRTPRHYGKAERCNRILAEEFLYARTYYRPHTAAGNRPRASYAPVSPTSCPHTHRLRRSWPSPSAPKIPACSPRWAAPKDCSENSMIGHSGRARRSSCSLERRETLCDLVSAIFENPEICHNGNVVTASPEGARRWSPIGMASSSWHEIQDLSRHRTWHETLVRDQLSEGSFPSPSCRRVRRRIARSQPSAPNRDLQGSPDRDPPGQTPRD